MNSVTDNERHKKALLYTGVICAVLLLAFILISWTNSPPPPPPVLEDLIEVNLGNNDEGAGEEQPLVKGDRSPERETAPAPAPMKASEPEEDEKVKPEDDAPEDAAPITKTEKKAPVVKAPVKPAPVITPVPKPQKPKLVYDGPGKGNGNNVTQDNDYRMAGNDKNGKGDAGDPKGDKDSYGDTPGGKKGGIRIISGTRKLVNYFSFSGDLPKATINAVIKVSAGGVGTFAGFAKGSTSPTEAYAAAIRTYLRNMPFDKAPDESFVTVQFNFRVQ